jgi:hypothetical protein
MCDYQGESRTTRCPPETFAKCHLKHIYKLLWLAKLISGRVKDVPQRRWVSYYQAVFPKAPM